MKYMKRNSIIDTAKGIGIFLVVFGHLNLQEPMQTIIYSFHIPLFFIISGLLFDRKKYADFKSFLARRLHTLIIPYLIFAIGTLAFYIMIEFLKFGFSETSFQFARQYFIQIFIARYSLIYGPNTPMWFVPCLFLTECFYFFIVKIKNRLMRCSILILMILFGWFTQSAYCHLDFSLLPWNFSAACFAIGFYASGNMLLQNRALWLLKKNDSTNPVLKILLFLCFGVILYFASQYNGHVSLGSRIFNNGLIFYTTGLIGTALTFMIAVNLCKSKTLCFWGRNSFIIMSMHIVFYNILSGIYQALGGVSLITLQHSFLPSFITVIIVIIMCSIFSVIYGKLIAERIKNSRNRLISKKDK